MVMAAANSTSSELFKRRINQLKRGQITMKLLVILLVIIFPQAASFVSASHSFKKKTRCHAKPTSMTARSESDSKHRLSATITRRNLVQSTLATVLVLASQQPQAALAATRQPLEDLLYKILRVREATQQEARLINSGKFKDVQRANVKLAVKFMLENYRLADQFVQASTYIEDAPKRLEAAQVGQSAVQNLYTILEYFDSSDVENIKVGQNTMAGKEAIVLKGLDATRQSIDSFIGYFPQAKVDEQRQRIKEENTLNIKEFDSSLGDIVNLPNP